MATTMIEWSAHQYYGSGRPWVALVTGRCEQYGYAREFLRGETRRSRSGATGSTTWEVGPGLYECRWPRRNHDDGGWRIVYVATSGLQAGQMVWRSIDDARRDAIIARLDAGEPYDEARRATRPAKEVRP